MSARMIVGRGSLVLVMLMGLMGLAACLPVPLGDPAKSKADSRYLGVWEWRDGRVHRAVIRPWDEKTFVVDVLTGELWGGAAIDGPVRRPSIPTSTIRSSLVLLDTHRCRGSGPGNAGPPASSAPGASRAGSLSGMR